jgi:hypothetical protein
VANKEYGLLFLNTVNRCVVVTLFDNLGHGPNIYILSSLFEKLRDARDKSLVCKNRKPNKSHDIHRIINKEAVRIVTKIQYV